MWNSLIRDCRVLSIEGCTGILNQTTVAVKTSWRRVFLMPLKMPYRTVKSGQMFSIIALRRENVIRLRESYLPSIMNFLRHCIGDSFQRKCHLLHLCHSPIDKDEVPFHLCRLLIFFVKTIENKMAIIKRERKKEVSNALQWHKKHG